MDWFDFLKQDMREQLEQDTRVVDTDKLRQERQARIASELPKTVQNVIKPQEPPQQFNPATAEARTIGGSKRREGRLGKIPGMGRQKVNQQLTPDVINRINQDPNAQMAVYDQYVREQNKRMPFGDARLKDIPLVGGFASGYAGGRNIGDIRVRDAMRQGADKFAETRAGKILGKVGSKIPGIRNMRSNLQAQAPSPKQFTDRTGINLPKTMQESDPDKLQQYAEESEKLQEENRKQLEERQKQLEMDVSRETDPEKQKQLRQQFQDSTKTQQEELNQQLRDIEAQKVRSTNLESVVSGRTENPETSAAGRTRQAVSEGRARPNEQLDPRSTSQGWFQQMYGNMLSSGQSPAAVAAAQARAGKRIEQAQQRRSKT
tara:strand:- start:53 stop:1177 length:1125 start_codon:yes stop_codon:yes gene_type:complete